MYSNANEKRISGLRRPRPSTLTTPALLAPLASSSSPSPSPFRPPVQPYQPHVSPLSQSPLSPPNSRPNLTHTLNTNWGPRGPTGKGSKPSPSASTLWGRLRREDSSEMAGQSDNSPISPISGGASGRGGLGSLMPKSLRPTLNTGPSRFVGGFKFLGITSPARSESSEATVRGPRRGRPPTIRHMRDLTRKSVAPTITVNPATPQSSEDPSRMGADSYAGGGRHSPSKPFMLHAPSPIPLPSPVPIMQGEDDSSSTIHSPTPVRPAPSNTISRAASRAASRATTRSRYRTRTPKPTRSKWANANSMASWTDPPRFTAATSLYYEDVATEPSVYDKSTMYEKSTVYNEDRSPQAQSEFGHRSTRHHRGDTSEYGGRITQTEPSVYDTRTTQHTNTAYGENIPSSRADERPEMAFLQGPPPPRAVTEIDGVSYRSRPSQYPVRPYAPGPTSTQYTVEQPERSSFSRSRSSGSSSKSSEVAPPGRFARIKRFVRDLISLPWRGDDDLYGKATGITVELRFRGNGKPTTGLSPRPTRYSDMPRLPWYTQKHIGRPGEKSMSRGPSNATTNLYGSGKGSMGRSSKGERRHRKGSYKGPPAPRYEPEVITLGSPSVNSQGTNPFALHPAPYSHSAGSPPNVIPVMPSSPFSQLSPHPTPHALLSSYHQPPVPGFGNPGGLYPMPMTNQDKYLSIVPGGGVGKFRVGQADPHAGQQPPPGPGIFIYTEGREPMWVPTERSPGEPPAAVFLAAPTPRVSPPPSHPRSSPPGRDGGSQRSNGGPVMRQHTSVTVPEYGHAMAV